MQQEQAYLLIKNYSPEEIANIQKTILNPRRELYIEFPWRRTGDSWHMLLAELLLQRTRATSVVDVYNSVIKAYPTPGKIARSRGTKLNKLLYPLGLPDRANRIRALAREIDSAGKIPTTYEELILLPGVGDYVASAWLSFSGKERSVIVDANVARWLARMKGRPYDGETRRKGWVRDLADRLTPPRIHRRYNYAVLDFTRAICKPVSPACNRCPLAATYCAFGITNLVE